VKPATATRTGYNSYDVVSGRIRRECRYGFLLALSLCRPVLIDQRGYRLPTEPERYRLRNGMKGKS
jgi:hypothetical protein